MSPKAARSPEKALGRAFHPKPTKRCACDASAGWHPCPNALPPGRKPLVRSPLPTPQKPLPRRRAGKPRRKPEGAVNEAYREWIRERQCAVFNKTYGCDLPIQAAHVKSRGAGGGDMGNLVPLCRYHHAQQHSIGIVSFQENYGVDLKALATRYAEQFMAVSIGPVPPTPKTEG